NHQSNTKIAATAMAMRRKRERIFKGISLACYKRYQTVWVAHASRVLVSASRRNRLSSGTAPAREEEVQLKFAIARTRSPARKTRALPKHLCITRVFFGNAARTD